MSAALLADPRQDQQEPVSLCGFTAGTMRLGRLLQLPGQRVHRLTDLGGIFLDDPAEVSSDSLEIVERLIEDLVAPNGPFIDVSELLGSVKIPVARPAFPLAQALGGPAVPASQVGRQERGHRRIGGIVGALQHVYGLLHQRHGTFGCVVVLHDRDGARARLARPGSLPPLLYAFAVVDGSGAGGG